MDLGFLVNRTDLDLLEDPAAQLNQENHLGLVALRVLEFLECPAVLDCLSDLLSLEFHLVLEDLECLVVLEVPDYQDCQKVPEHLDFLKVQPVLQDPATL